MNQGTNKQISISVKSIGGKTPGLSNHRKGKSNLPLPSPPGPVADVPSVDRALFLMPRWQQERSARLHRIFLRAEARIAQGTKITKAFRMLAWWHGSRVRYYRCDRSHKMHFTRSTLIREFYRWRKGGRTEAALLLRYRSGKARLPDDQVAAFQRLCLAPGFCSLQAVHAALPDPAGTVSAFRHYLAPRLRSRITRLFAQRRKTLAAEKAARRELAKIQAGSKGGQA
jgi:hypothetical protein